MKWLNQSPDDEDVGGVGDGEDDVVGAEDCEGDEDDEDGPKIGESGEVDVGGDGEDGKEGCEFAGDGRDEENYVELASVTLKCCDF